LLLLAPLLAALVGVVAGAEPVEGKVASTVES
jgi:hypothetical protein